MSARSIRLHVLLALALVAGCVRGAPVPSAGQPDVDPVEEPLDATAPPPFTPDQIRDAMPVGTHIRIRNTSPDSVTVADWVVVAADGEGVDIRYTIEDADGAVVKGPTDQRDTWAALRDHARFPADATRIDEDEVEVPAGTWPALRYTVERSRDGAIVTDTFWFAPDLPGPPVRFVSVAGGQEVFRMELLSRE